MNIYANDIVESKNIASADRKFCVQKSNYICVKLYLFFYFFYRVYPWRIYYVQQFVSQRKMEEYAIKKNSFASNHRYCLFSSISFFFVTTSAPRCK